MHEKLTQVSSLFFVYPRNYITLSSVVYTLYDAGLYFI